MGEKQENKYRMWMVTIQPSMMDGNFHLDQNGLPHDFFLERYFNEICEQFVFQLELTPTTRKLHFQCALKLKIRKRHVTLLNEIVEKIGLNDPSPIQIQRMMGTWEQGVAYCSKIESRAEGTLPLLSSGVVRPYEGSDIKFLEDSKNWYPWQKELFEILFEVVPSKLRDPNDRDIIWITDETGNSGKSKFVKFCCFHNKACTKISFGSAGQLRSAIIHAGAKVCYFVDMPRTLGTDDSINSIVSALEDCLNGFLSSSYYGESKTLLMEPPHVVVFSNQQCPYEKMSADRWKSYFLINKEFKQFR